MHPVTAVSRANLRPNPSALRRGGKKPRRCLTETELHFCALIARAIPIKTACEELGITYGAGARLYYGDGKNALQKARIRAQIDEYIEQNKREVNQLVGATRLLRTEFIDSRYIKVLRNVTDKKKVDPFKVGKLFEVGYKAVGAIQPTQVNNQANAQAAAALLPNGQQAMDVYEAKWLTRRKMKWDEQLEAKHAQPQLPPTNS